MKTCFPHYLKICRYYIIYFITIWKKFKFQNIALGSKRNNSVKTWTIDVWQNSFNRHYLNVKNHHPFLDLLLGHVGFFQTQSTKKYYISHYSKFYSWIQLYSLFANNIFC